MCHCSIRAPSQQHLASRRRGGLNSAWTQQSAHLPSVSITSKAACSASRICLASSASLSAIALLARNTKCERHPPLLVLLCRDRSAHAPRHAPARSAVHHRRHGVVQAVRLQKKVLPPRRPTSRHLAVTSPSARVPAARRGGLRLRLYGRTVSSRAHAGPTAQGRGVGHGHGRHRRTSAQTVDLIWS